MQTSSQPKLLPIPFANGGSKQDIPNDSQIGVIAGRASYTDGFPPLTRTPLAAGGVPPFGTDFNGVLNDITAAVRWAQAGAGYPFNATFNTAITGFPKGAKIPNSTFDGFWLNTTDGNAVNPENTTSALTGWVPTGFYGVAALTGLAGSSVTLTTLQAGRDRITLAGTLTANINLVVPAWIKRWEIVNNCTGAFSVTVKTPGGTGVSVASGSNMTVFGDGTNIVSSYASGVLIGPPQVFTSSGTYTPTAGTKKIIVEVLGAGGGGGGARAVSSGNASTAGGGGGGGYAKSLITSVPSSAVVTVGVGGAAGTWQSGGTATTGSAGGNSSFGSLLSATGGGGGGSSLTGQYTTPIHITGGLPGAGSNGNILNSLGGGGLPGFIFTASNATGGGGGSSVYSGGYNNENRETGIAGILGSGGTGCSVVNNSSAQAVGGKGGNGIVIVWEYA
ncbi:hypothetical protein QMZ65_02915 [Pantoea sp. EABMAA-21]|uniref:glycine-rich domain-containing protein n=1 Tax=Pantoea sp. EABMAA-21 TaxID=3043302 RepID=UPI0024B4FC10|nr:hypothetical protein [Pantoea sp. EABMAA-21]MDI9276155.1 hypothetical protein [Pantoea sp. EABMAA-21]